MPMTWISEMVDALEQARNGEKDAVISSYEHLTGKSAQTLYRIAKRHGYNTERKPRGDKGKSIITRDQAAYVAGLMEATAREIKGQIMPVGVALDIAGQRGIIEHGAISSHRMGAILRAHGMDKKTLSAPAPRTMMRSLYPNHVHVFDASICIQYYLKNGKGLSIMDERKFYKNKPQNFKAVKNHIIRYVLADHFSHALYVKYYYAAGENKESVFDFLLSAWGAKGCAKLPFRGVCEFLLMDAGSANICKPMGHFLAGLGIRTPESLPHNPSRQGSAEVAQNIVETNFECRLGIQPAYSIEELNTWALDWTAYFNATRIHKRHGLTRTQCWLKIAHDQLRELPDRELLTALFASPSAERTVTPQYVISYRPSGRKYEALTYSLSHVPEITPGSKVTVMLRPLIWPEIGVIWQGREYAVKPIETGIDGFASDAAVIGEDYKAVPETPAQRFKKEAENLAYGEAGKKDRPAFPGSPIMGNMAERIRQDFIPRAGTPLKVDKADLADRQVPITEFMKNLIAAGGPLSVSLNRLLRETYGSSIPSSEADRLIDEYVATGTITTAAPDHAEAQAC